MYPCKTPSPCTSSPPCAAPSGQVWHPPAERPGGGAALHHRLPAGLPEPRRPPGAGGVLPPVGGVGVLPVRPAGVVPHRPPAPAGGGTPRMGVFATRSPFRPNPIGLSCVKIHQIQQDPRLGPVIHVLGGRPDGRHPHSGPEALHPHRRPPRGGGGVFGGPSPGAFAGGVPPGPAGRRAPGGPGRPGRSAGPGSPALLPGRPPSGCTACPSEGKNIRFTVAMGCSPVVAVEG